MTSLAVVVAARMGTRAGELWRTERTPTRNPFRHPAMAIPAAQWRRAYVAAATAAPREAGTKPRPPAAGASAARTPAARAR